jgi:dinuclear metal center YbgI/SA1388 family protein
MVLCEDVVRFLDEYLLAGSVADSSLNGLQVQGRSRVRKIVFGVSANMALFEQAQKAGADMIIVHHGLLWGKEQALTGTFGRRVGFLLKNDISLLGYHLPLDKHPVVGHNALLLKALKARALKPFAQYHGQNIGFYGEIKPIPLTTVVHKLEQLCGSKARVFPFGPSKVKTVGAVSGGGWSMISDGIEAGLDLFITGSVDEPLQELCREGKITCVDLGHYNSEKIGILALMKLVQKQFGTDVQFIDIANPI